MEGNKYKHRVLFISDPHYTVEETRKEYKLVCPNAIATDASAKIFGYTQKERMNIIIHELNTFMDKEPVEAVLVLGDLGTDDYGYRNLPLNYCRKFKEECMEQLASISYALPGNHDSYPNDMWREVFGYDRQYSVKIGDAAFIMLDTYQGGTATNGSGSPYTGVDVAWLEQELVKYPNEKIFLCVHGKGHQEYDEKFHGFMKKHPEIVCMLEGHSHKNEIMQPEDLDQRLLINVNGYSYHSERQPDGKWRFDTFEQEYAWGYGVLEWNDTQAHYYHIKHPRRYVGNNGVFDFPGALEDEVTIEFK